MRLHNRHEGRFLNQPIRRQAENNQITTNFTSSQCTENLQLGIFKGKVFVNIMNVETEFELAGSNCIYYQFSFEVITH